MQEIEVLPKSSSGLSIESNRFDSIQGGNARAGHDVAHPMKGRPAKRQHATSQSKEQYNGSNEKRPREGFILQEHP